MEAITAQIVTERLLLEEEVVEEEGPQGLGTDLLLTAHHPTMKRRAKGRTRTRTRMMTRRGRVMRTTIVLDFLGVTRTMRRKRRMSLFKSQDRLAYFPGSRSAVRPRASELSSA
jgi:hypothetical protein